MNEPVSEQELLSTYAANSSPAAFAQLVRANADLVYASARRQMGDIHLAEDVTQAVFLLLARKASSVKAPAAGWLLRATHYACLDARKLARRRQYHERQATLMRSETVSSETEAIWESYAAVLDDALNRLRDNDRNAIALRFLRSLPLKEVAAAMRITEKAAEKRVNRALGRLRTLLTTKASAPAAATLASQLAARGSEAAPAKLVEAIAGGGAAANSAFAAAIAHKSGITLTLLKAKLAALLLLALALAAAAAGEIAVLASRPSIVGGPPAPAAQPAPAIPASTQPAEITFPGQIQLARWDVLLDENSVSAIMQVSRPAASKSVGYKALRGIGAQWRAALAAAMDQGEFVKPSQSFMMAHDRQSGDASLKTVQLGFLPIPFIYFEYGDLYHQAGVKPLKQPAHFEEQFTRIDDDHLHVALNHTGFPLQVSLPNKNPRLVTRSLSNTVTASFVYQGDLAAGEAVGLLGRFDVGGFGYYHLVVFESFKAKPTQLFVMQSEADTGWWAHNGPDQLRRWADSARFWACQSPNPPEPFGELPSPGAMPIKLSDGKSVWLVRLCRPAKWPSCWWDTHGDAVNSLGGVPFQGAPPQGLWAAVVLDATQRENSLQSPNEPANQQTLDGKMYFQDNFQLGESDRQFEIGAPVGPWVEIGHLTIDHPLIIDGVKYVVKDLMDSGSLCVYISLDGLLDDETNLIAVDRAGKDIHSFKIPIGWSKLGRDKTPRTWSDDYEYSGLKKSDLAYFRLMRRKRQFVTFTGFATNPTIGPRTNVTTAEADAAEKLYGDRQARAAMDQFQLQRAQWAKIPPDPTKPMGALRVIINAGRNGDEKTVRQQLLVNPSALKSADMIAHLLATWMSSEEKAFQLFGETTIDTDCNRFIESDIETMLMNAPWKSLPDGSLSVSADQGGFVLRKCPDGQYRLSMPIPPDQMSGYEQMRVVFDDLHALLWQNPPPTLAQVQAMLKKMP